MNTGSKKVTWILALLSEVYLVIYWTNLVVVSNLAKTLIEQYNASLKTSKRSMSVQRRSGQAEVTPDQLYTMPCISKLAAELLKLWMVTSQSWMVSFKIKTTVLPHQLKPVNSLHGKVLGLIYHPTPLTMIPLFTLPSRSFLRPRLALVMYQAPRMVIN